MTLSRLRASGDVTSLGQTARHKQQAGRRRQVGCPGPCTSPVPFHPVEAPRPVLSLSVVGTRSPLAHNGVIQS